MKKSEVTLRKNELHLQKFFGLVKEGKLTFSQASEITGLSTNYLYVLSSNPLSIGNPNLKKISLLTSQSIVKYQLNHLLYFYKIEKRLLSKMLNIEEHRIAKLLYESLNPTIYEKTFISGLFFARSSKAHKFLDFQKAADLRKNSTKYFANLSRATEELLLLYGDATFLSKCIGLDPWHIRDALYCKKKIRKKCFENIALSRSSSDE